MFFLNSTNSAKSRNASLRRNFILRLLHKHKFSMLDSLKTGSQQAEVSELSFKYWQFKSSVKYFFKSSFNFNEMLILSNILSSVTFRKHSWNQTKKLQQNIFEISLPMAGREGKVPTKKWSQHPLANQLKLKIPLSSPFCCLFQFNYENFKFIAFNKLRSFDLIVSVL